MASKYKLIVRTTIPSQIKTKLFSFLPTSSKLVTRLCSSGGNGRTATSSIYEKRKFCHQLSSNSVMPCFPILERIPSGIFRETGGEILGLGAGKCCMYQNPEYFSYHHMSFYDLNMGLRQYRLPSPKSERKPN